MKKPTARFINHCGAETVTLADLRKLPDPKAMTETHFPIRHDLLIDTCKESLVPAGFEIVREEYSLRQESKGNRLQNGTEMGHDDMFGIMEFASTTTGFSRVAAIRNSGTMKFLAQLGCGERVFVCDNLCFSAQIVVGRKHTRFIERDLPVLAGKAIAKLSAQFEYSEKRIEVYKESPMSREAVHDVMVRTHLAGACAGNLIKPWLAEYVKPSHEEFEGENAWGLKNAFTEIAKRFSFEAMQTRTQTMQGLLDQAVDIDSRIAPLLGGDLPVADAEVVDAEVVGV
jgi:hypothetical protein